jgi:hypothetical protein
MRRLGILAIVLVGGWSLACGGGAEAPAPADAEGDAAADAPEGEGAEGDEADDVGDGEGDGQGDDAEGDDPEGDDGEGDDAAEGDEGQGTPDEAAPAPRRDVLPADLDPNVATKANAREEALLDKYKKDRNATSTITRVLKTDPANSVRVVAVDVLKARWKLGIDQAGAQDSILWCARSGDNASLQAKCLEVLGDKGNAKAGPTLNDMTSSQDKAVSSAAAGACKEWMKRFPRGVEGATGACKGR